MEANFTWRGPASSVSSFMLNSFSFSKCLMSPGNLPPQSPSGKGLCSATPTLRHYGTNWKTFVQHQSIPGGIPRVMEMECCVQFSELQSFPCAGRSDHAPRHGRAWWRGLPKVTVSPPSRNSQEKSRTALSSWMSLRRKNKQLRNRKEVWKTGKEICRPYRQTSHHHTSPSR